MTSSTERPKQDWDPRSEAVLSDQIGAYDGMRHQCPVAHSDYLGWSLFSHDDVVRVLDDHESFSSVVSTHLSVPSGMDPPQHTAFRQLIERYFEPERVKAFEPVCREISKKLVSELPRDAEIDLVAQFAQPYAVHIQCAFLGWPDSLQVPLLDWVRKNHKATLARDTKAMAVIALEFDEYIRALLDERRRLGMDAPDDVTTSLLRDRIDGRALSHEEIVSILRNWTVGELGTITACVGILCHHLANNRQTQALMRGGPDLLPAAIDEILRLHAPLISNRRVTTRSVTIGGREIPAGEKITLMWASANRDEAVFDKPDELRLNRDHALNLLYGRGIHVCPGAELSRMELRVLMEELLGGTRKLDLVSGLAPVLAVYPASGFSRLPARIS
ncbi:cytochrome P450 [Ochrobactrum pecoris]|uniref:Cytochrome P450 n=1 Tax=Brucella pecoris TaxID=867683 RepID=A0A5C5CKZ2_9HYPH|nr:cytochrome P450 [Brucella pecoris]MBB4094330.1 hypothetical protein [Brucella pecoris]NKW81492.1 cytochrome P450 [Brucella pecoris]TNV12000.1 cytochrome P450 [Brucella pecoris]